MAAAVVVGIAVVAEALEIAKQMNGDHICVFVMEPTTESIGSADL